MSHSNEILGYRVLNLSTEMYVHVTNEMKVHFLSAIEPEPIPRGDAYRRLAAYLDEFPLDYDDDFTVEPVYRVFTPKERSVKELGELLMQLCKSHNLDLGLTQDQMNKQIEAELDMFTAGAKLR